MAARYKYRTTFDFFDTEEQAQVFCDKENKSASPYVRKKYPAHYTPWSSQDGKEHKFIAWYVR